MTAAARGPGRDRCDPTWNHPARWILLYVLPLGLLALALQRGAIAPDRDLFAPLLWGLFVPFWNTREQAGKPWVFKDFQARDSYSPMVALLHAAVWCLATLTFAHPLFAALAFAAFFLVYDGLLLHYRLLCVYGLPLSVQRRGSFAILGTFGLAWWAYVGAGLAAIHTWGADTPLAITLATAAMILPAQSALWLWRRFLRPPERLASIRRVAVIGAGWNGIYATKWLAQHGLDVTCFDARPDLGGTWLFCADRPGGVFERTCATSSKHFLHASDLPFDEGGDFPTHHEVLRYLRRYCRTFDLERRLSLGTTVLSATKQDDGWRLLTRGSGCPPETDQEHHFDALVVASGPQGEARIDPCYRAFEGPLSSAEDYKSAAMVRRGERVLVVGAGESAADIVTECVLAGAQVHWSTHRGQWFADRHVGPHAADQFTAVGLRVLLGRFLNVEYLVRRFIIATFIRWAWGRGGHGVGVWEPQAPYLHQYINKSRDAIRDVHWGRVVAHGPVRAIRGVEVAFNDGGAGGGAMAFDRMILATGYKPSWPFLQDAPRHLYKLVFAPEDPTLAFVGFARPVLGSIPSLGEVQARWVATVLSGRVALPARALRLARLHHDLEDHARRFDDNSWLGSLVGQESYSNQIATYGGFQVRWLRLLLRPRTLWVLLRSPWIAFKFQLHAEDGTARRRALDAIARELPGRSHPLYAMFYGLLAVVPLILLALALLFVLLEPAAACSVLAATLLVFALLLRWSERPRRRKAAAPIAEAETSAGMA